MCISDIHLGLWAERNTAFSLSQKADALEAMVRYASEHHAERIVLAGDILDDRAGKKALKRESRIARHLLGAFSGGVLFLRGNHDRHWPRKKIQRRLGPCRVEAGVVPLRSAGLVLTHGDILDTRRARRLIASLALMSPRKWKAMNRAMEADGPLNGELRDLDDLGQSLAGIEKYTSIRHAFEIAECTVRNMRTRLADLVRRLSPRVARRMRLLVDGLDIKSIRRAGQLAGVLDGWATIFGHNHTPGLYRRDAIDPRTGTVRDVLVGNCGSFIQHRQPITCIFAAYPSLNLLAYEPRTKRLRSLYTLTLESAVTGPAAIARRPLAAPADSSAQSASAGQSQTPGWSP